MKIAIYTHNINDLGGIERVVREQLRIFAAQGVECKLFGDEGGRTLLTKWKPDYCILHGVVQPKVADDIAACHELNIPVIAVCHFSFPSAMLLDGDEAANRNFLKYAKLCDMVAPVSEIDTLWWRALGCRAMHVQNPFVHPKHVETIRCGGEDDTTNLLWVGRNAEPKQPSAALAAFAHVVQSAPNVHLTMIGGSDTAWNGIRKRADQLGIGAKVTCLGQRDDINDLWDKADIHLLTSVTESFCLVLAEAKAKGIPTAMFEIPFLELVEGVKGLVTAPQGDVEALAAGIVELVKNPDKRRQLGREAFESIAPFNDEAVWQSWMRVFKALKTGEGGYEVDAALKTIVTQQHCAWNRFCEKNFWAVQMARDVAKLTGGIVTMRVFARTVRRCVRLIQLGRQHIRGYRHAK